MKVIFVIFSFFAVFFTACETDFNVNAEWEETAVVYGLLDAGRVLQQVKISKAFLGEMDAFQMAQYADSINYDPDELDVKIYRWNSNNIEDSVVLDEKRIIRDGEIFHDSIVVYEFANNEFIKKDFEYELVITNKNSNNVVSSRTEIVTGFNFDISDSFKFGFVSNFDEDVSPYIVEYSSASVKWGSNDNGKIYQLDLIFHYTENGLDDSLIFSQELVENTDNKISIEGEKFFNFLSLELNDTTFQGVREFVNLDLVMTVGSEDLETYIKVNKPITGITQQRPPFTNINNGIGLFSSRFTKFRYDFDLTSKSKKFLTSVDGLDRNFQ